MIKLFVAKQDNLFKKGFTLAEVLITLGIIGVVSAITMPMLIANINERTNSERQANIAYKITQAMEQMRAHGELDGSYKSTDEFVDVLQKYLKIAKRCDANDIASCWPTEKIITSKGEDFEIKNAKTRKDIIIGSRGDNTNNVGLILSDGASIILSYDTSAKAIDIGDRVTASKKDLPVGMGKTKEFAYTTSVTSSIDFITDVNGKKGPNSEAMSNKYNDIRSFRVAKFSKGCAGTSVDSVGCTVNLGTDYEAINTRDCKSSWDSWCGLYSDNNYWAGAKKVCGDMGLRLPNSHDEVTLIVKLTGIDKTLLYWINGDYTGNRAMSYAGDYHNNWSMKDYRRAVICVE